MMRTYYPSGGPAGIEIFFSPAIYNYFSSMDNITKVQEWAKKKVYADRGSWRILLQFTSEELDHIASIGASIVLHDASVRTGGGFVSAVCANDLSSACSRADSINQRALAYLVNAFKISSADCWTEATGEPLLICQKVQK
jgi:hypothetical protein